MTLATWITFFLACWAISLSPGPGAIAAMSAGLNQGFRRGYFTVFGLVLGIWTQLIIVVVGLGALIAASNTAFTVLKFLGAAYLVWVGISQWRASDKPLVAATDAPPLTRKQLVDARLGDQRHQPQGRGVHAAVVPNFIDLAHPLLPQYLVIMAVAVVHRPGGDGRLRGAGVRVLRALNEPHHVRIMNRCFGSLFIVAGSLLAAFRRTA